MVNFETEHPFIRNRNKKKTWKKLFLIICVFYSVEVLIYQFVID